MDQVVGQAWGFTRSAVQAGSFAKLGKQDQERHHGPAFLIE